MRGTKKCNNYHICCVFNKWGNFLSFKKYQLKLTGLYKR